MADYVSEARRAAQRHGLDPNIFVRQIRQESGFNPNARSPAGAVGIAQIMPATARGWGVDPTNPRQALNAAAANMARYVKQFGSYENALRAYNAGPGNVEKSKGFGETNNYVSKILGGRDPGGLARRSSSSSGGGSSRGSGSSVPSTRTITTTTPGVDNRVARASLISSFLEDKNSDPLDFALQARSLQDIPATTSSRTVRTPGSTRSTDGAATTPRSGGDLASFATERANALDAKHFSYQWGGGHGQKISDISKAVPVDCSGAVSAVLGIDPRVSGQFGKWGRPGDGGGRGVTIYSNGHHVLMKINGHFFGTSGSNPGGGAGWIPQSAISPDYLKGFTVRHSAR